MKTYKNLWKKVTAFDNLVDAYNKARKHKNNSPPVMEFSKAWAFNLGLLKYELEHKTYQPIKLKKFILREPKTRVICKSDFRDRIVHHALVNVLHPIFEPRFISDSYASRVGKGTLNAIKRFYAFERKITRNGKLIADAKNNNEVIGYCLKCDIKHYFETVDRHLLVDLIERRVKDENVIWLIWKILDNYESSEHGKGMPLGNWTSQFFANIYLNELDQFVKHELKAKFYIRYVDDFIILNHNRVTLENQLKKIRLFIPRLKIELHPQKCKIIPLKRGVQFLGYKNFHHYKTVSKRNLRKIRKKMQKMLTKYESGKESHEKIFEVFKGWDAYAKHANSRLLRAQLEKHIADGLLKRNTRRNNILGEDLTLFKPVF